MRRDLETTSPEAAAEWDRNNTPAYDHRHDLYEPDLGPTTRDPAVSEWAALVHECGRRAHRLMHGETP